MCTSKMRLKLPSQCSNSERSLRRCSKLSAFRYCCGTALHSGTAPIVRSIHLAIPTDASNYLDIPVVYRKQLDNPHALVRANGLGIGRSQFQISCAKQLLRNRSEVSELHYMPSNSYLIRCQGS